MVKRKRIALVYQFNDNWIGGTYYILNIIKALNSLDDSLKPQLKIITDKRSPLKPVHDIGYPYLDIYINETEQSSFKKISNKIYLRLFGLVLFKNKLPLAHIDNLYPVSDSLDTGNIKNYYYWIPDFQEHYLPQFFSKREIFSRKAFQSYIVKGNKPVVFSSLNALNDFDKFYPENHNKKVVLNFISIVNSDYKQLDIAQLQTKFGVSKRFFIICNQFWRHKNHQVVLDAIKLLNDDSFEFLFTGKEHDHRYPEYANQLKKFVEAEGLSNKVKFLGFIDREEQLKLMENAIAIIQPSLFEGWSTVVEDAKILNKLILLSDIPLHKEQISNNVLFFDPLNAKDLANVILKSLDYKAAEISPYQLQIQNFATQFIDLFE